MVLLNAGASAININILTAAQSVFTRDISIGGNAYTEALQKELSLSFEQADMLKKGVRVEGAQFDDAQPVLRAGTTSPYSHATLSPATELVQMRVTQSVVRQAAR